MQMQSGQEMGGVFSRSWELLSKNWIIIVPGIVIAILMGIVMFLIATFGAASVVGFGAAGMGGAGVGAAMLAALLFGAVGVLGTILTLTYTTGMAGKAWATGTATLADGAEAMRRDGMQVLVAIVLLFLLGLVAAALTIFTFGLSLLAYLLFFLYTMASVIVGERSGTEGIAESAQITIKNFLTTLIVVIAIGIVSWVASWIGGLFHNISVLGNIIQFVIQQIVIAYFTLVVVGEYLKLRPTPAMVASGYQSAPPPPPPSTPTY